MEVLKIDYDKDEIVKKTKETEVCFKCSACSKFCPVTAFVAKYDIENSYIAQLYQAERAQALRDVWMCSACEKCVSICPQDGDPTHVFTNMKEVSYKEGLAPDAIYAVMSQILDTGTAYQISKAINSKRSKLGLKEIELKGSLVADLKKMAEKTGLKKKE